MTRKPTPPPDDPEQSKRFKEMAREVEAETADPDFDRIFRKVAEQSKGRLLSLRIAALVAARSQLHHKAFHRDEDVLRFVLGVFPLDMHCRVAPRVFYRIERCEKIVEDCAVPCGPFSDRRPFVVDASAHCFLG